MSKVYETISGRYQYSDLSVDVIGHDFDYDFGPFMCGGSIRQNEKMCVLRGILSLLSSHVCRGNFSKHSEGFGRILGVQTW